MDPHDIVKLDANENPYGPPPEVRQALGSMQFPNIYPDPETRRLRASLAEVLEIPMEHLLVGVNTSMHISNNLTTGYHQNPQHGFTNPHQCQLCAAGWLWSR